MKLISLNIWGGRVHEPLFDFIKSKSDQTDIFTFQEVLKYKENIKTNEYYADNFGELQKYLPDFDSHHAARAKNLDPSGEIKIETCFGQATFVNSSIKTLEINELFVYGDLSQIDRVFELGGFDKMPSLILCTKVSINGKKALIINFHGLVEYAPKLDNEHRLRQSQIIIDHIQYMNLPTILAGDFNLRIDTKSLQMFEDIGMRNLLKESGATTTRTKFYEEKWRKIDQYADYIFTTPDVNVNDFKVLEDEVSDHLPLSLDFEV